MSVLSDYRGIEREVFIETGTSEGETLWEAKDHFKSCYSLEKDLRTFEAARMRFARFLHVFIVHANSAVYLARLLDPTVSRMNRPTTFWLDAHYLKSNGDPDDPQCPLLAEVNAIARYPWTMPPIILIDDAWFFDDSIDCPGYGPFWQTETARVDGYRKEDFPRIEEIDRLLPGYRRTLLSGTYFKYEK